MRRFKVKSSSGTDRLLRLVLFNSTVENSFEPAFLYVVAPFRARALAKVPSARIPLAGLLHSSFNGALALK